jgi:heme/copper-type cytochrome/quinol oxidase subunit 1
MHFLGVAGMPRRIPDYPDAFFILNKIATWGSYLSAFSLLVFFGVLFDAFVMNDNTQSFLEKKSGRILYVHSDHNTS